MAKISVVVPVYKVEKYIHRCVDSILNQTYADFELILVDDGSPDNCPAICDEYAERDARIVVIHQKNGGVSVARNTGLDWVFANSNSRWLSFIDSDDWVHPQYFELLVCAAEKFNVRIAACQSLISGENQMDFRIHTESNRYKETVENFYCNETLDYCIHTLWAKLYDRTIFSELRCPVGRIHEDVYLVPRSLFPCSEIAIVPEKLYVYYQHSDSIIHVKWSPQRLDQIAHYESVCAYLSKIGERKSFKVSVSRMFSCVIGQLYQIQEIGKKEYEVYFDQLRRKAQFLLLRYPHIIHFPFHRNKWTYEMIFPNLMKIYWKYKQLEGKFKR